MAGRSVATKLEWVTGELFPCVDESGQHKGISSCDTAVTAAKVHVYISSVITSTFTRIRHWSLSEAELHVGQVSSLSRPLTPWSPWHQLGTFLPTAGFFFFVLWPQRCGGKKKMPVYLRLWNCTAEDKHASQFHRDIHWTNMSSLLSLKTSASGEWSRSCITSYYVRGWKY